MFSIYLFLLLILKNQIENIQYNVAYLLLSKTFLFDQTHFTRIYDVVNHKNNNCNQQQQVFQVFGRKSFENIYSGVTSCRTLLEVRPKDKFRNYISSDQLVWNIWNLCCTGLWLLFPLVINVLIGMWGLGALFPRVCMSNFILQLMSE